VQGLSHCSMKFIIDRHVLHHRAEPLVPGCHSDRLLSEDAGLTSSSTGELAITTFLLHGRLTNLFSHLSTGDRPKPKPGASRPPPGAGPAIHCQSTPPSVLLFDRLLHGTTAAQPEDDATPQVTTTSGRTTTATPPTSGGQRRPPSARRRWVFFFFKNRFFVLSVHLINRYYK
jgi:hypothetical protein